jgi:ParB/RepB/Spo0J family partition protein
MHDSAVDRKLFLHQHDASCCAARRGFARRIRVSIRHSITHHRRTHVSNIEPIIGSSEAADDTDLDIESPVEPLRAEREGLPRGYRMRADTHYVDHLGSQAAGQPVRMVAVDQIASPQAIDAADLRPLIDSIRTHGIVHPLLIARRDTGYAAIAGHKRLAAARMLRLPTVPCLLHHVDDAQAALLARADNLHGAAPSTRPDGAARMAAAVQQAVVQSLAIVQASADAILTSPPHLARAAMDLVAAHSWRAARLLDALDAASTRQARPARKRSLASAIEQAADGFAAEGRLNGVAVRTRIEGAAAGVAVNAHDVALIVSSAVLATLPLFDRVQVDQPAIVVSGSSGPAGPVRLSIAQSVAPVPSALAEKFFDESYSDRAGGWCALACALAVKAVTERAGGAAAFEIDAHGHSSIAVHFGPA